VSNLFSNLVWVNGVEHFRGVSQGFVMGRLMEILSFRRCLRDWIFEGFTHTSSEIIKTLHQNMFICSKMNYELHCMIIAVGQQEREVTPGQLAWSKSS